MEKVKLMTDSACDIGVEDERRYGIRVLPFKLVLDGVSYTSRVDFDDDRFYELLEAAKELPVTSQLTPFEFEAAFSEYWAQGYTDVIYTAINAAGSQTYANALLAADSFFEAHPEAREAGFRIHNIDSGSYTGCYGYAVLEAARRLEAGATADELVAFLRDWCAHAAATFVTCSLKYAGKSGRIPSVAAQVGNALGIKPLLRLHDHEIHTVGKLRSEKAIIPSIVRRVESEMEPGSPYCIVYGNDPALGAAMTEAMRALTGREAERVFRLGAAVAINSGPRMTGVAYRLRVPDAEK